MLFRMKGILLLFVFISCLIQVKAQQVMPEVVCTASGNLKNSTVSIDWVIGETVTATMNSSNNTLSNGFEQSTYIITAIKNNVLNIEVSLFPNPTKNSLNLQSKDAQLKNGKYQLIDMAGKIVSEGNIKGEITAIDFSMFGAATYYLVLMNQKSEMLHSYKVVKQ